MNTPPPLHVGDLVRCPHCRRWHPAIRWHTSGTDYTLKMLYFDCKGQRFYAGQNGLPSRHETSPRDIADDGQRVEVTS